MQTRAIAARYLGCRGQRREFGVARDVDKQIIGHPATGRIVGIGRWNSYREQIGFGVGYRSRERALRAPITVEGVAIESDVLRQQAIIDYARIIHQAIEDGIDVRGYYWWSAWDNFEWHLGPTKRFGLYACDLHSKDRTPRLSAKIFADLAYSKTIPNGKN